MDFVSGAEDRESLPILQVNSWGPVQLDLTEFKEASLSPGRDLLLLLSHQCEALLVPLKNDLSKQVLTASSLSPPFSPQQPASPKDCSQNSAEPKFYTPLSSKLRNFSSPHSVSKCTPEGTDTPQSTPFYTPAYTYFRNSSQAHDTSSYSQYSTLSYMESSSAGTESSSCSTSSPFPVISDVRSTAWGCLGDECTGNKHAGNFKQLLFISGKRGLVVHAFCSDESGCGRTSAELNISREAGGKEPSEIRNASGRSVNWGTAGVRLDGRFADVAHASEESATDMDNRGASQEQVGDRGNTSNERKAGSTDSSRSFTSKKWLDSFLIDMEMEESGGNIIAKFPVKSSIPSSAKVVSFYISCTSSAFLNFIGSGGDAMSHARDESGVNSTVTKEHESTEMNQLLATDSVQPLDSCLGDKSCSGAVSEKFSLTDSSSSVKTTYKFSKLFSSPSCRLVGMVLTGQGCISEAVEKQLSNTDVEFFLLVAMVYEWGISWVCSVDLQNLALSLMPESCWSTFQLSEDILFGLKESGSVFMWSAMTGKFIGYIDVLYHCGLDLDSHIHMEEGVEQVNNLQECEIEHNGMSRVEKESGCEGPTKLPNLQISGKVRSVYGFTGLLVTANSLLISVTDKHGLVYVICTDEYFAGSEKLSAKSRSFSEPLNFSDLSILSCWEVAGSSIGSQKQCSELPNCHWLKSFTDGKGKGSCCREEIASRSNQVITSNPVAIQVSSDSSVFMSNSRRKDKLILSEGKNGQPLRRIFLPSERSEAGAIISLSPYGVTKLVHAVNLNATTKEFKVVHAPLHLAGIIPEKRDLDANHKFPGSRYMKKEKSFLGEVIGFCSEGCLYLVSQSALHVVLPPLSLSPSVMRSAPQGQLLFTGIDVLDVSTQYDTLLSIDCKGKPYQPWQIEVLDRALVFDGLNEAEHLSAENGWSLKTTRLRRLQLALDYLQSDDIEQALEALVAVNAAEEGVLRVLFTAVEQVLSIIGGDNEIAQASRLLALAARFATKMVCFYGRLKWNRHNRQFEICSMQAANFMESSSLLNSSLLEADISGKLCEMAHLLEVIRNIQDRVNGKRKRPIQGMKEAGDEMPSTLSGLQNSGMLPDLCEENLVGGISSKAADVLGSETIGQGQGVKELLASNGSDQLALSPLHTFISKTGYLDLGSSKELSVSTLSIDGRDKQILPLENPRDMVRRWEMEQLDLTTVVKDALRSGRLPLAVLQLHRLHSQESSKQKEPYDFFKEVQEVGKTIVYDFFCEGKTALAIAALHRLGENVEVNLRELAFGTVRRPLRSQVTQELKRHSYLRSRDVKILERVSLLERLYPSGSFWSTYAARQRPMLLNSVVETLAEEAKLQLICAWGPFTDYTIECGEIDGVVIGSWSSISTEEGFLSAQTEDNTSAGYWAGAAVWLDAWDQRTVDRVILDQPFFMGVHIPWEAQFEYFIAHNDWEEVSKLLDIIPPSVLKEGTLHVQLDFKDPFITPSFKKLDGTEYFSPGHSVQELDAVEMDLPKIKLLKFSLGHGCAMSMRKLIEEKLAENFIFLQAYWKGTQEIISLLARAGLIFNISQKFPSTEVDEKNSDLEFLDIQYGKLHKDTVQAFHVLVLYHCIKHDLPHLLDIYLDSHSLALDNTSVSLMRAVAGDCHWAQWLLLSRIKGFEYDASFSNAWSNLSRNVTPGRKLDLPEIEDLIPTVDDMAEGGGEKAALATLMYAPVPLQRCLCSGSVNRHRKTSWQCTVENLRPALQIFPTLWRSLLAACFGQDACSIPLSPTAKSVNLSVRKSGLFEYLNWRDGLFSSAGGDTSLLQMVPRWFPKAVRRLLQLSMQGPVGGHMLAGNMRVSEAFAGGRTTLGPDVAGTEEVDALSWEVALQKNIEEELYASSFEEGDFGVEHHLHRGRALAAFNCLIGNRAQRLNLLGHVQEQMGKSSRGQSQASSEMQVLLSQLTQSEEKLLISVMPLAIMHFENNVLVASCAFLLELCGLSASVLRVDVASLRRISSFYHSLGSNEHSSLSKSHDVTLFSSSFEDHVAASLARALADEYVDAGMGILIERHMDSSFKEATNHRLLRALKAVLQHLEKSSLPEAVKGQSPGSWLLTGEGDGPQLRAQQRAASERWSLVTTFCQMHQIPMSTMYLATLAKDNDWVGFLAEAQLEGCPIDILVSVAAKEFTDARLKSHILTVLKGMQSSRQKVNSTANLEPSMTELHLVGTSSSHAMMPTELFGLLAECETQKTPGKALLVKAKDLRWPLLAIIASCFSDVSPLSCLTVWLEITAARETSAIKVNDVAAQIANSVGAAVEATNTLPGNSRALSFRYNRKNPKRRRLMEQGSMGNASESDVVSTSINVPGPLDTYPTSTSQGLRVSEVEKKQSSECLITVSDAREEHESLSKMVAVLCEQQLFLPLLKAFDLFIPSCSLLPFIRFLQAFSQMRLSEASAHLTSFSNRLKEEILQLHFTSSKGNKIATTWITSAAVKAADAMLSTCPSAYERRCILQLLAAADFGDGGSAAARFRRFYWKIQLADPALRQGAELLLDSPDLDDGALLTALEKSGHWEEARSWARQLELSGPEWKSAVHHVTETQAEAMVAEWKEFLWDVPGEQAALWSHCQSLFIKHSFPPLQAGIFFLKHAEAIEKDVPALELHGMLLLALQWLSGSMNQSNPVYPLHLLREIETRVWLLAVESEVEIKKGKGNFQDSFIPNVSSRSSQESIMGNNVSVIDQTASIIAKMDSHLNAIRARTGDQIDDKELSKVQIRSPQVVDASLSSGPTNGPKLKRRNKGHVQPKRALMDNTEKIQSDAEDNLPSSIALLRSAEHGEVFPILEENIKLEATVAGWEEKVGAAELERSVLALLEVGQIAAAKQLQQKLSPTHVPSELLLVEEALKVADISNPTMKGSVSPSMTEPPAFALLQSLNLIEDINIATPLQVLEAIATKCREGCGRGLCNRILAVVKIANFLELSFSEAFHKQPIELLQLLSLKAQDSLNEARLLVETHSMPAANIARILAESFLKGLLAAHRGGYMESSQREEGPAPLLWRASDFLKWAELCPSEPEVGHALMRLVISGHDMPHACEVELLILAHHFYKSSACLDGVDVLVALAATRVESYVAEGDFSCLARLVTGVSNFHSLYFMLDILIENGQLELLLQKYAVADATTESAKAIQGFRMTVLSALKHFNPDDLDAFAMVYNHFDMKHEMSALLELRARKALDQWLQQHDREQSEDLLEMMRFYVEAAEVYSSIDAGNKTRWSCAQASLVSLQIRMPDTMWLNLSETNARRLLVEQSRFQEALIVAEAYTLNQSAEWVPVLWNQMLRSDLIDQFLAEFVAVLPLPPTTFMELARFYRAEVMARGDQSHFSTWLNSGGLPLEWAKHLGKSFRSLLRQTRDIRLRIQLATIATGFPDIIETCMHILDKVPDTAGPLILRKGHGGAYLPLM